MILVEKSVENPALFSPHSTSTWSSCYSCPSHLPSPSPSPPPAPSLCCQLQEQLHCPLHQCQKLGQGICNLETGSGDLRLKSSSLPPGWFVFGGTTGRFLFNQMTNGMEITLGSFPMIQNFPKLREENEIECKFPERHFRNFRYTSRGHPLFREVSLENAVAFASENFSMKNHSKFNSYTLCK